jgi:hypothetical protein
MNLGSQNLVIVKLIGLKSSNWNLMGQNKTILKLVAQICF